MNAAIELTELVRAGRVSQSIAVAAQLGVADHVADRPLGAEELAERVGADPQSLYRVLRLCADAGVFAELEDRRFGQTRLSELLRSDRDDSMRGIAMLFESPFLRAAWTKLLETVRTGAPAFDLAHGAPLFEYLAEHPRDAAVFDAAMVGASRQLIAAILDAYDFSSFDTVVDVGGGNGALLALILSRNPGARGVLYELPGVTERAKALLADAGVIDRCEVVAGDFFESVPAGGDAYVLTQIVHDWGDKAATQILQNCRAVMDDDARLLLGEAVLPDGPERSLAKFIDVEMLVIGGRERTETEYRELLAGAGLRLTRVVPSALVHSVVEAVPDRKPWSRVS
jgi:hypothetical protein